ncbi:MAG: SDR family NAD(P)-dependent oxidoreductase [Mesorhizobium sp.]
MKVLIFGAGYSGKRFAEMRPENTPVLGTTRSRAKFPALQASGIQPLQFYNRAIGENLARELTDTTHLIMSIAPDESGDPVLDALSAQSIALPKLQWVGYLSTVGVYGDYQGAWVNEDSACNPVSGRSRLRLEAEQAWQRFGETKGTPVSILRLSGIYGPGRNAFVNLQNGTAKRLIKPGQVFNRIHADDIGASLWHLIGQNAGGIFNVTDNEPAPPQDVVSFAANLMGVTPPPEIPFETAQLSPMARSFYGENKRVSNARLKATGYAFRYPNYRAAFETMWREGNWQGAGETDARSPIKP